MPKTMPNYPNAESAILGIILIEPNKLPAIMDRVFDDDFYSQRNTAIYKAMKDLYKDNLQIDYTSIIEKLNDMNLSKHADLDYIIALGDSVPTAAHLDTYIGLVKDAALKRQVIEVASDILERGYTEDISADDFLTLAEEEVFALAQKRKTSGFKEIADVVRDVKERTEFHQNNKNEVIGLETGFHNLDRITLGFQREELIILAARPAMGKSAFAMNVAINVAKRNNSQFNKKNKATVAIFSLEMSNEQLAARMLSAEADVNNKKIRNGSLEPKEWVQVNAATESLAKLNIVFDDSAAVTVSDIRAKCRQLAQSEGLDFVVIDYLQLIKGNDRIGNRQEEVANISRGLKQMARELKIPILALAQLSRAVEQRKENKNRPTLADLRESGSIEQDADIVMFLYREDYYAAKKPEEPIVTSVTELNIAKNRQGVSGVNLKYNFILPVSRFTEYGEEEED
ncbi:replicative DNA helicase [Acholeplasma sp. OttesenSCG-928-E16]|nr:replicative DNA helicase [Acholeplasma sp. OttesenSCG-928-E16]